MNKHGKLVPNYNNDWKGEWSGKDGVLDKSDFLNNPDIQKKIIVDYHKIIWKNYLKDYQHYHGTTIEGVELTKSGMVAAAHLVGHGGLKTFIDSNGKIVPTDGNNVPCTKYLELFKSYELNF